MEPADIGALTEVTAPRLSPGGEQVAFVAVTVDIDSNDYQGRVWTVPVDGSQPPRPLSAAGEQHSQPRWSPDGRQVAFVTSEDTEEPSQITRVFVVSSDGRDGRCIVVWRDSIDQ